MAVVLNMSNNKLTMLNRQPENRNFTPWSAPIKAHEWNRIVLGMHMSSGLQGGWVELYLSGEKQIFTNGEQRWPCPTWDSSNDPKWGVYGARDDSVTNLVDGLKVGTTPTLPERAVGVRGSR
jgi:hypothetical protein